MRETVRSLSIYFVVAGAISGIQLGVLLAEPQELMGYAILGLALVISLAHVVMGLFLKRLLATRPKLVIGIVTASSSLIALAAVVTLARGGGGAEVAKLIVGALLTTYLLVNVRRLSRTTPAG